MRKRKRKLNDYQNKKLAESAIINGRLILRGSREWEDREVLRANEGNKVLSWGFNDE